MLPRLSDVHLLRFGIQIDLEQEEEEEGENR